MSSPIPTHGPEALSLWLRHASKKQLQASSIDVSKGTPQGSIELNSCSLDYLDEGQLNLDQPANTYTLRFIASGEATLTMPGSPGLAFHVGPSSVLWNDAKSKTQLAAIRGDAIRSYTLSLQGARIQKILYEVFHENTGCLRVGGSWMIESLFGEIYLEAGRSYIHRKDNCTNLLRVLLNRIDSSLERPRGYAKESRVYFDMAQQFIDSEYGTISSIEDISQYCGITPQYLIQVFKAFAQTTPHQYLTRTRLYAAKDLLFTQDYPVRQIAKLVGYENAGLFSTNFKKEFGTTPGAFRLSEGKASR